MKAGRFNLWAAALVAAALPVLAFAQAATPDGVRPHRWQLNMSPGVTQLSHNAYSAHMLALGICIAIGILVFGAMGYAMFKFRYSQGAVPDVEFTHSAFLELVWTVVPIVILVAMAYPATMKLINMYDVRQSQMTIKVTGFQWMWKYDYLEQGVSMTSRLKRESDHMRQSHAVPTMESNPNYLLEVDHELVVPVHTKIRFVVTADDVIHAWWVPSLGWKQDAIPGIVNEAWADVDTPGVYRGQCAELCGKDHGFMPIVVRAVPKAEFDQWIASKKAEAMPAATPGPAVAQPAPPAAAAVPTAAKNSDTPTAPVAG